MSNLRPAHRRVGIFTATEVHTEAAPGEWLRDDTLSTDTLSDVINSFLDENNAFPISASPPAISLVAVSEDKKRRTFVVSASVIYRPQEIIRDGTEEAGSPIESGADTARALIGRLSNRARDELLGQLRTFAVPPNNR